MGNKGGRYLLVSAEENKALVLRIFHLIIGRENAEPTRG
jgi:hypothetical protein